MSQSAAKAGDSRVWIIEDGPGPENAATYMGLWKIGDTSWNLGDVTDIKAPSSRAYNRFDKIGSYQGEEERVTTQIMGRYLADLSDLLRIARKRCPLMVQVYVGKCRTPTDYAYGWQKIKVYPDARISTWSDENAGALDDSEQNMTNESADLNASELYELKPLVYDQILAALTLNELTGVAICDDGDCGDCGDPSDGCQHVFFAMDGTTGSPTASPSVIVSKDKGESGSVYLVNTVAPGISISALACVGAYLVLVINGEDALEYARIADLLAGTPTWTEVATGFVAAGSPSAIYAPSPSAVYIAGDGGYVYKSTNIIGGVTAVESGSLTVSNLTAIHGLGSEFIVAGGASGVVIFSQNGGKSWAAATAVTGTPNISQIWVISEKVWWAATASGLYYTLDGGVSWTAKTLPGTATNITDIQFVEDPTGPDVVGIAIGDAGASIEVFRTWNGGETWVFDPRPEYGTLPGGMATQAGLALCEHDPNLVFIVGDDGASGGVALKGA